MFFQEDRARDYIDRLELDVKSLRAEVERLQRQADNNAEAHENAGRHCDRLRAEVERLREELASVKLEKSRDWNTATGNAKEDAALIASLEAELAGRWISAKEALPEKDGRYLVRFRKGHSETEIAIRARGEWWVRSQPEQPSLKVAYWMPLPAPPAKEE